MSDVTEVRAPKAPEHVKTGQRYAFTTAAGDRREYVVTSAELEDYPHEQHVACWVHLKNEATGGVAVVTPKWLYDPPGPSGAFWQPIAS